jgi:hypothetical protein
MSPRKYQCETGSAAGIAIPAAREEFRAAKKLGAEFARNLAKMLANSGNDSGARHNRFLRKSGALKQTYAQFRAAGVARAG